MKKAKTDKKVREKKVKEKKPRKPKTQKKEKKPKKPKKARKPVNKKLLIIISLVLIAICLGAGGFYIISNTLKTNKANKLYGPLYYFTEDEAISSVRQIIGNVEVDGGYTAPKKEEGETEESEDAPAEEKLSQEENTEAEEEPVDQWESLDIISEEIIPYISIVNGENEAKKYAQYLCGERGFLVVSYPEGTQGTFPDGIVVPTKEEAEKAAEEAAKQAEEDAKKAKEDAKNAQENPEQTNADNDQQETPDTSDTEEDADIAEEEPVEFVSAPAGVYKLTKDSVTDGTALKIMIDYTTDSYKITLQTASGNAKSLFPKPPEKEKEASAEANISMEGAVAALSSLSATDLLLPDEPSNYNIMPIEGRFNFEGEDYYDVRVYRTGDGGANYYVGSYYVDCRDGKTIYKYDSLSGSRELIREDGIATQVNPQDTAVPPLDAEAPSDSTIDPQSDTPNALASSSSPEATE